MKKLQLIWAIALLAIVAILITGLIASAQQYQVFVTPQALGRGQQLQVEQNVSQIRKLHRQAPDSILIDFPVSGPQRLYKVQSAGPNSKVLTNEGKSYKGKKYFGVSYRNTTTAIQVSESEIVGLTDTFYIAPTQFLAQRMLESLDTVVQFKCEQAPEMIPEPARMGPSVENLVPTTNGYIEVDFTVTNRAYTSYLLDLPTLTNRLMARLNIVFQNFGKEKVLVRVRNLIVNTAPDNYNAQPSSTTKMSQHKLNNPNNTAQNAFLIDNTDGLGGVAWLGTVCSPQYATYRFGYASVQLGSAAFNTYSYDTYCITHELSHAFGLHHGFWCGWNKLDGTIGAIDSTYQAEGGCFTLQKQGGPDVSFMSYNHLWTTSFPQQFGKVAGPVLQGYYNGFLSSGCIVGAQPIPTCATFQYGAPYGPCINGQRTHTVISALPSGCIGGNPTLTEACTVVVQPDIDSLVTWKSGLNWCGSFVGKTGLKYTVELASYPNATSQPKDTDIPFARSVRNGWNNKAATVAKNTLCPLNPQPSTKNIWYSMWITCNGKTSKIYFLNQ